MDENELETAQKTAQKTARKTAKNTAKKTAQKTAKKTAKKLRKKCEKSPPVSSKMEHLIVRFQNHLPYRVERLGDRSMSFPIPKRKRLKTLQFTNKHPQHIIRKRKSSWEVIGTIPLKQRGGQYNYRSFDQWLEESF